MPNIDECLIKLKHDSYLSTLDMSKGFWQVPKNEIASLKEVPIYFICIKLNDVQKSIQLLKKRP